MLPLENLPDYIFILILFKNKDLATISPQYCHFVFSVVNELDRYGAKTENGVDYFNLLIICLKGSDQ